MGIDGPDLILLLFSSVKKCIVCISICFALFVVHMPIVRDPRKCIVGPYLTFSNILYIFAYMFFEKNKIDVNRCLKLQ